MKFYFLVLDVINVYDILLLLLESEQWKRDIKLKDYRFERSWKLQASLEETSQTYEIIPCEIPSKESFEVMVQCGNLISRYVLHSIN